MWRNVNQFDGYEYFYKPLYTGKKLKAQKSNTPDKQVKLVQLQGN